jgi:hypothetical protein
MIRAVQGDITAIAVATLRSAATAVQEVVLVAFDDVTKNLYDQLLA